MNSSATGQNWPRVFLAMTVALLVTLVTACANYGSNLGDDPTSLAELAVTGGATYEDLTAGEIARRSEMAIEVRVTDVRRSYLNTEDGRFPSAEDIGSAGLGDLAVLTPVEVEVMRTLARQSQAPVLGVGESFVITVGGGAIFTVLDVDQAAALGMTTVVEQEFPEHVEGDGREADVEIEVPVTEPVDFVWGSAPDVDLSEGDVVVVFLDRVLTTGYRGATDFSAWTPVHPEGIYRQTETGDWLSTDPAEGLVNVDELAGMISPAE